MSCAIVGIGRTAYSRSSGRTTRAMAVAACRDAIADAGLIEDVDGICTFMANDSEQPIFVAWALGRRTGMGQRHVRRRQPRRRPDRHGRRGHRGRPVQGGAGLPLAERPLRATGSATSRARCRSQHDDQFDTASGFMVPPQWFAMWARRHQHEYGSTCRGSRPDRDHPARARRPNEHAVRREPLTMDDYLAGRWINEPFRVLDCTSEVDGAVAILIIGRGHRPDCTQPPMWLVGSSNSQGGAGWTEWDDPTEMYSRTAGPKIWEKTGSRPPTWTWPACTTASPTP